MFSRFRLAAVVLGFVCLLAWLAPDADAQAKKGKPTPPKAKAPNVKGKGKGPSQPTQSAIRDLQEAQVWLAEAQPIYDGHRGRAYNYVQSALSELYQAGNTNGGGGKQVKGKTGKKVPVKKGGFSGTGETVVKLKDSNNLPVGWEVSNGQMQQAGKLVQSAISKLKGTDAHAQAASAHAQLALQRINTGLSFMNSLVVTNTKKKAKGR